MSTRHFFSITDMKEFYINNLFSNVLPFWDKAIDREEGGIFTCFTNDGSKLISTDKYTWAQGRFLWWLSRLYYQFLTPKNDITAGNSIIRHHIVVNPTS